jgi:hypothetical protein
LIAAIEATGQPQSALIAKVLELLPSPPRSPEYKLSGTLIPGGTASPNGLRFWLQPKYAGQSLNDSVTARGPDDAIRKVATEVFVAISRDAPHVFPQWAQWQNAVAATAYVDGIGARLKDKDEAAEASFQAAASKQTANLLPRLQLANLAEKAASDPRGEQIDKNTRAKALARVLRRYLDIGVARPDVIAARYRAAIVAGMLAGMCEDRDVTDTEVIATTVGLIEAKGSAANDVPKAFVNDVPKAFANDVPKGLYWLAQRECNAAYQLTGLFHILLDQHRLRHRYEPTGIERRRLRRSIAISRHTLAIRQLRNDSTDRARREIRWRRAVVRWVHLGLFRASAGWNAHYNAGCFYALLSDRGLAGQPSTAGGTGTNV